MTSINEILIFVYGTLKKNQPNHQLLVDRNVNFISEATPIDKWPLIIATERNVPFLLNKIGFGKSIKGELYKVNNETIEFLDEFEGVKAGVYSCFEIKVIDNDSNQYNARTYILDNFKKSLLNDKTILFDDYSSVNDYFGPYIRKEDFPNFNFDDYIKQIKDL